MPPLSQGTGWVFLFDVDGTLLWSGEAGARALERALFDCLGLQRGMEGIVCDGKTDPAIVREILTARGLDADTNLERILRAYVELLPGQVAAAEGYRVLPGVRETLEYLRGRKGTLCGLATGNLESGARAKLARGGLNGYFPVGGFGSDAEDRGELVRMGVSRARECLGDRRARAVVIGDTPRDVAAARAAGALAVAVATGRFDREDLRIAGADLVLLDLTRPESWTGQLWQVAGRRWRQGS